MRGLSVEPIRRPVFNLTVEGYPEYFANGVLVHNCDTMRYAVMLRDANDSPWTKLIGATARLSTTPTAKPGPFGPVGDETLKMREARLRDRLRRAGASARTPR